MDTSALIDFGDRYPRDIFPSLWQQMEDLARRNILRCPRAVARELEAKSADLKAWVNKIGMALSDEEEAAIANSAADIDSKYPDLKKGDRRGLPNPRSADHWVIALAQPAKATVISHEGSRPHSRSPCKIPDVCQQENIRCIRIIELFRNEGWQFR